MLDLTARSRGAVIATFLVQCMTKVFLTLGPYHREARPLRTCSGAYATATFSVKPGGLPFT